MENRSNVDEIWIKLGKYGKYQTRHLIVTICASISMACHIVSFVFIGYKPDHICTQADNDSELHHGKADLWNVTYEECSIAFAPVNGSGMVEKTRCLYGHTYSTDVDISFVTEWDLVCDKDALAKMSQTLVSGGMFLGAIASPLADKFGRRPVHCAFNLGYLIVTLLIAFVTNFKVFMVLRFLTGACQQGMLLTIFTLWIEMFPTENRTMIGILNAFMWTSSFFLVLPFAYLLKDFGWRIIQLGLSLLSSIAIVEYCLIDESLRWLLANDRFEEACAVITKAAKMNGVDENEILPYLQKENALVLDLQLDVEDADTPLEYTDNNKTKKELFEVTMTTVETKPNASCWKVNVHWLNLITVPSLRRNSIIIWITWVVNNLAYYGLLFMMPALAGDIYMNYCYSGVTELVSTIILVFVLKYMSRRNGLFLYHAVGGICLVLAGVIGSLTDNATINRVLTLLGRGAITASFNSIYLYTPELFPTNLRNAGMGVASGFGRFAGMLAPFSVYLADLAQWAPGVLFGVLCFIVAILLRYVPETKGKELAQTVEELKQWENKDI